jgi:hypothetical protein
MAAACAPFHPLHTRTHRLPPSKTMPMRPGEELVSRLVNGLIHSPLYGAMVFLARLAMKDTARRHGVDWDGQTRELLADPQVRGPRAQWGQGRERRRKARAAGGRRGPCKTSSPPARDTDPSCRRICIARAGLTLDAAVGGRARR